MNYLEAYNKKINRRGRTKYERNLNHKIKGFNNWFANALNKETVLVDGEEAEVVFQDHSQANNKDLSDDKYVVAPLETKIGVGSYIYWRDYDWLVFTEEEKTIPTHQQLKVKETNWTLKWIDVDTKELHQYSSYVQNQTLYTLGVSYVGDKVAIVNAKMMLYIQDNEYTRNIKIGQRVYLDDGVYKILFKDKISRVGLINCLLEQDLEHKDYDNPELKIADYYRDGYNPDITESSETGQEEISDELNIKGQEKVKISSTAIFKAPDGHSVKEWIVESLDDSYQIFKVNRKDEKEIELYFIDNFRGVGKQLNIFATLDNDKVLQKTIRVLPKY